MLGKLIKYDILKYKYYLYVYIAVPVFALITKFTNSIPDKSAALVILDKTLSGCTLGLIAGLFVNIIIRSFVYFQLTLYADEAYLSHTLPVKRGTLYVSKALSGLIVAAVSFAFGAFCLWIVDSEVFTFARPSMLLLVFAELACIMLTTYLGIILGHRKNTKKKFFSILCSVGIYMVEQLLVFVIIFAKLGNIVFSINDDQIPQEILNSMYVFAAVYVLLCVVLFFLGKKALEKGVNID